MNGWAAQQLGLPAWWYGSVNQGAPAVDFPISGDATTKARANPPIAPGPDPESEP